MTVTDPESPKVGTGEIAPDPHALDHGGLDVSLDPFPPQEESPGEPRAGLRRAPLLAALALLLGLGGWVMFGGTRDAYLQLDGRSDLGGRLTVLVDGEERYTRELSGPRKKARGLGRIKKMIEPAEQSFETWIELGPGKHEIEARIQTEADEDPFRDSVVVDLEPGEKRRLRLVAGRSFGKPLSLKLD